VDDAETTWSSSVFQVLMAAAGKPRCRYKITRWLVAVDGSVRRPNTSARWVSGRCYHGAWCQSLWRLGSIVIIIMAAR